MTPPDETATVASPQVLRLEIQPSVDTNDHQVRIVVDDDDLISSH